MTNAERVAIWKKQNPEKHKAQRIRYREKHKDDENYKQKDREHSLRYYYKHREEILEKQ